MFRKTKSKLAVLLSVILCVSMISGMGSTVFATNEDGNSVYIRKTYDFKTKTWSETTMPEFDPTLNVIHPTGDLVTSSNDITPYGYDESNWTHVSNTGARPYKAIAQLEITYEDGSTAMGSGFAAASGKILTAAHCILNGSGSMASSITLYFGRNGSGTYMKKITADKFDTFELYNGNREFDVGIIEVPKSITDYTGTFGLYAGVYPTQVYTLSGYPNSGTYYNDKKMYTYSGKVDYIWDTMVSHSLYACGGMSGSPIYGSNNYAVSIHVGGYDDVISDSVGSNITSDVINFVAKFK